MRPGWWMTKVGEQVRGSFNGLSHGVHFALPFHLAVKSQCIFYRNPMERVLKTVFCVISGVSKHQSQSNSWMSTLPLVPGSLRAAGICCLLFTASCLSHLWSFPVFTVKLFIQVPYSLSGFAEGAKVFKQKMRAREKQPLAATLVHSLLQRSCSRQADS